MTKTYTPLRLLKWMLVGVLCSQACSRAEFHSSVVRRPSPLESEDLRPVPVETNENALPVPFKPNLEMIMGKFSASSVVMEDFRFTLDPKEINTEFQLKDIHKKETVVYRQVNRPSQSEVFIQGYPPKAVDESFDQEVRKGLVDILIVVDNSSSMKEEQKELSEKLNELVSALGKVDWQIGIINTSPLRDRRGQASCSMETIRSSEADAGVRFKSIVSRTGTGGSANEEGFFQAVTGLSCPSKPWLRAKASLAVLIVSDEDNCSDGRGCGRHPWKDETYLINYVEKTLHKSIGKDAAFYGVFSPPSAPCDKPENNMAYQYQKLVDYKADGAINYGSICDPSYKPTLNRISENIATLLTNQFELKDAPLPNSLVLKSRLPDGTELGLDQSSFSLETKTITFFPGKEPIAGAKLLASYLVAGRPMWKEVELLVKPDPNSLEVLVNGEEMRSDAFSLSGHTLSLQAPPSAQSELRVRYRHNMPLTDSFLLPFPNVEGSPVVTVDGKEVKDFVLDKDQKLVTFTNLPADNSEVSISWIYREGPELSFVLPLGDDYSSLQIMDGSWSVPFTEESGVYTIPLATHRAGKMLSLRYQVPESSTRLIRLPHVPLAQSARMEVGANTCQFGSTLSIKEDQIVSTCGVRTHTEFAMQYSRYQFQEEFALAGVKNPDQGTWRVQVDGVSTDDYQRSGATIRFNGELDPQSKITLQFILPEDSAQNESKTKLKIEAKKASLEPNSLSGKEKKSW